MEIKVTKVDLKEIQHLRVLFLHEGNFQFTYDKCHRYGWADTYLFAIDDLKIGYGSVWGKEKREDRNSIFEFYILPPYIKLANRLFNEFHKVSGTSFIECQSNDLLLTSMLYEYAQNINAEAILFEDHLQTNFILPDIIFQKRITEDNYRDDDRQYILKLHDGIVASGGLMLNYNIPYADIYYEVNEKYRQRGFGTFIVQELKKEAYLMARVPAARCNVNNTISKTTLLKAGFKVCGNRLIGEVPQ